MPADIGPLAHRVEQGTFNPKVPGSSPGRPTAAPIAGIEPAQASPTVLAVVAVPIRRLDPDLPLPAYAKPGDAGCDLLAAETVTLAAAGGRAMVPTGIAVAIPPGYAGFVQPRSGLAWRHGVTCVNSPGLIDSGYRDELRVLLLNTDPSESYEVQRGDRIAQLVIQRVEQAEWHEVETLDETERGLGGFGHSGR